MNICLCSQHIITYDPIYFLGEPNIALQDVSLDNEDSDLPESLNHSLDSNIIGQKRFKCYICEGLECLPSNICNNAITVKIYYSVFIFLYYIIFILLY